MKVSLNLLLECTPDSAWRALRSPAVFTAVSSPFTTFTSLEPGGFPTLWAAGDHPTAVKAFGLVPIGTQVIRISYPDCADRPAGTRAVHDTGFGSSGILAWVHNWHHIMEVSPDFGERTRYRDTLTVRAGLATPALWVLYWSFWQWRALRIRQLARGWNAAA